MTVFDYAVLAVLVLSALFGLLRGGVSEVLALAAWVLALFLGKIFAPRLAPEFARWVPELSLQYLAAFAAIALAVLLAMAIARWLARALLQAIGLGLIDRMLGAIFGLLRGVLILLVAVALAGLTALPREAWWRDAVFSGPLETAVVAMKPWLPPTWASKIRYR